MADIITLKLTNAKIAALVAGLAGLDGLRVSPNEFRPYRYDDDNETIWLIAGNAAILGDALKRFEHAKKLLALQHQVTDGTVITEKNAEQVSKFMQELSTLEEKEVEVEGLQKISRARLKVGKGDKNNPIPPSVLARLWPLLED